MDIKGEITFKKYTLIRKLASSHISTIWLAENIHENTNVVITMLNKHAISKRFEDIIRFKNETSAISKLITPGILKIFEVGEYDQSLYVVMEYFQGISLSELLGKNKPLNINESLDIVLEICEALKKVHASNISHRELRPENILINEDRSKETSIKIYNFGISHVREYDLDFSKINDMFYYISPEQSGFIKSSIDERSDIYSLGIIFYQLLTSTLPFTGESPSSIIHQHIAKLPLSIKELNFSVPWILEKIVFKMLEKEPEKRYQSIQGLINDLKKYKNGEKDFEIGMLDKQIKLNYRTSLIGREEELNVLKEKCNQSMKGVGSLCLISGEAGQGKTRLVDELINYIHGQECIYIYGKCFLGNNKTPFSPFIDALNEYLKFFESHNENEKEKIKQKIKENLGDLGEVLVKINPQMKKLFEDCTPLVNLKFESEKNRVHNVVNNFFSTLGSHYSSIVIILDDLQWIDDSSIDLLLQLTSQIINNHILIIGTYRDDEIHETHPLVNLLNKTKSNNYSFAEIKLKPFDINKIVSFISKLLFESSNNTREIAHFILQKGKGNPYFSIEILKHLISKKVIVYKEDKWHFEKEALEKIQIPSTIIDIILKRIHELTHEEINVLANAAVIGKKFSIEFLYSCLELEKDRILKVIDKSISMQLLEQDLSQKGIVLFVHDRIKEAFYKNIDKTQKKRLHLIVAKILELTHINEPGETVYDIAHHYINAEEKDKALEYVLLAGIKSLEKYANEDAIKYYLQALKYINENCQHGSKKWFECIYTIGHIYVSIGKTNEAINMLKENLKYISNYTDEAFIYNLIGIAYSKHGDNDNCQKYIEKGLKKYGITLHSKKALVIFDIIIELFIHIIHKLAIKKICKSNNNSDQDTNYIQTISIKNMYNISNDFAKRNHFIGFSFNSILWSYGITDTLKFVRTTFKSLNFTEAKLSKTHLHAMSLTTYASMCMAIPLFEKSKKIFHAAFDLALELDYPWGAAEVQQYFAHFYNWTGSLQEGIAIAEKSANTFNKLGDLKEFAMSLNVLVQGYYYQSNYDNMSIVNGQFYETACKLKDAYTICAASIFYIQYYREKGDYEESKKWGLKSIDLSYQTKDCFNYCSSFIEIGITYIECNEISKAIDCLEKAKKINEQNQFLKQYTVLLYQNLAEAYIAHFLQNTQNMKRHDKNKYLNKIKRICKKAISQTKQWVLHHGGALRCNARYQMLTGNFNEAEKMFLNSINHCNKYLRKYEASKSYYEYGLFLKLFGREKESKYNLETSYNLFKEIKSTAYEIKVLKLLGVEYGDKNHHERLSKEIKNFQRISSIETVSRSISSILDLDILLDKVLSTVIEISGAQSGCLMLKNNTSGEMENIIQKYTDEDITVMEDIIQEVLEKGTIFISTNTAKKDKDLIYQGKLITKLKTVICIPIKYNEEINGICYLENKLTATEFTKEDINILNSIIAQAAVSIENAKLFKAATTDGLTGLITHSHFKYTLKREIEQARQYNKIFSIIMFDIDKFKIVNDTYGHQAGDTVLTSISKLLKDSLRTKDVIARYGGDEIAIILPETDINGAFTTGEKIRDLIKNLDIINDEIVLNVTISVGIATYPRHASGLNTLIKSADKALYKSKQNGRDMVSV
ncbi:diguanylate cyclase [Herbivorax sp. ANBcel31]|uniref:diguanylate cyclase n=1 Tax=Herbivorax sp. ANBcel31 TaxID=3069754 RepID=UPI0027B1DC51|nr:diguanylate cyclase [Herbivorax sp. ANBcel31]MDQ2085078.1 diguanylate cyclase [Herbivorax sp. ANBcel31]